MEEEEAVRNCIGLWSHPPTHPPIGPVAPDAPSDGTSYFTPHIDKANKKAYDFSAIVYLNSQEGAKGTNG